MTTTRWEASISVGIILSNGLYDEAGQKTFGALVMVQQRDSGLWGIPAGHVKPGETSRQAVLRELWEETNKTPEELDKLFDMPGIREIPGLKRTRWGIWYEGYLKDPIPKEGYEMQCREIKLVKPWSVKELMELEKRKGEGLYLPDFNLAAIGKYLDRVFCSPYQF